MFGQAEALGRTPTMAARDSDRLLPQGFAVPLDVSEALVRCDCHGPILPEDDGLGEREQGGRPAHTFTVTIRVPELSGIKSLRFAVRRSGSQAGDVAAGMGVMHSGVLRVSGVSPLELLTLRSVKSALGVGTVGERP